MKVHCLLTIAVVVWMTAGPGLAQQRQGPGRGGEGGPGAGPGRGAPPAQMPLLRALDRNGDGELSSDEIAQAAAALKQLDENRDGTLSGDEMGWPPRRRGFGDFPGPGRAPRGPEGEGPGGPPGGFGGGPPRGFGGAGGMVERMLENDQNKDGKLTRDELPEFMQGMIERLDEDGDGAVSRSELEAMAARMQRGGFGGGGGGGFGGDPRRGRPERPQRPPMDDQ